MVHRQFFRRHVLPFDRKRGTEFAARVIAQRASVQSHFDVVEGDFFFDVALVSVRLARGRGVTVIRVRVVWFSPASIAAAEKEITYFFLVFGDHGLIMDICLGQQAETGHEIVNDTVHYVGWVVQDFKNVTK